MSNVNDKLEKQNWKKQIIMFLTGQASSLFGSSLVQYAIIWYITLNTQSGIMMMIATLCGFLPQVAISLFAGIWADRFERKKIIIYADLIVALATLILAIVFMAGYQAFWLIFVVLAIRSMGSGVQMPAIGAVMPQIVPEDKLIKVNGIYGSIQSVMLILSPIASAALLVSIPLHYIFFVDIITATIAIIIMLLLKIEPHVAVNKDEKIDYFKDLIEGFSYVRNSSFLGPFFLYIGLTLFFVAPVAMLTPLMVTRTFGENEWFLTLNEISFFIGTFIGGFLISIWGGFSNRIKTILLASTLSGLATVLMGFSSIFWVYLIFMGVVGLVMSYINAPSATLIQETTKPEMIGRVFSIYQILFTAIMPMGMLLFGPLSDVVKIEWLLIATGGVIAISSGILFIKNPFRYEPVKQKVEEVEATA